MLLRRSLRLARVLRRILPLALSALGSGFALSAQALPAERQELTVDGFFYHEDEGHPYVDEIARHLERLTAGTNLKINFVFTSVQNQEQEVLNYLNAQKPADVHPIVITHNDAKVADNVIKFAAAHDIPVVFLIRETGQEVNKYPKAWLVGANRRNSAIHQAEMLSAYLNAHPKWDRNGNGKLDYVLLKGADGDTDTVVRSRTFKLSLSKQRIAGNVIAEYFCDWRNKEAKEALQELFKTISPEQVEAVICNNDAMAIGALEALQEAGYNLGTASPYTPLLGVDGDETALRRISEGSMTGTVLQDPQQFAEVSVALLKYLLLGYRFAPEELGVELGNDARVIVPSIPITQIEARKLMGSE
ncbi:MAG: substrate-binding domain-containing protein [Succinivibrio sp.]|nr:substrate-binding domain-containing protein [Succinivibrio sp.]